MAHNPHAPQGPAGNHDPAGSTQMFRAFVDEEGPRPTAATSSSSGPRVGLIIGIVAVVAVVAAVAWLALS
ncbi:hypothetical protein [Streptomyces megasporus]|uniref:hypothetical protein n=1 Tax=Streptomyces megasporus TaxID=44060 RepID=UPI0004E17A7C|nr:hypothetical protein [Streptomyces megasporus]